MNRTTRAKGFTLVRIASRYCDHWYFWLDCFCLQFRQHAKLHEECSARTISKQLSLAMLNYESCNPEIFRYGPTRAISAALQA